MNDSAQDLYDFSDISDLPEEMQERFTRSGGAEPALVGQLIDIVDGAPRALTMTQIRAVATRMGIELPAEVTVRNYLNKAVETGRMVKASRQTYGKVSDEVEAVEEDDELDLD